MSECCDNEGFVLRKTAIPIDDVIATGEYLSYIFATKIGWFNRQYGIIAFV